MAWAMMVLFEKLISPDRSGFAFACIAKIGALYVLHCVYNWGVHWIYFWEKWIPLSQCDFYEQKLQFTMFLAHLDSYWVSKVVFFKKPTIYIFKCSMSLTDDIGDIPAVCRTYISTKNIPNLCNGLQSLWSQLVTFFKWSQNFPMLI